MNQTTEPSTTVSISLQHLDELDDSAQHAEQLAHLARLLAYDAGGHCGELDGERVEALAELLAQQLEGSCTQLRSLATAVRPASASFDERIEA